MEEEFEKGNLFLSGLGIFRKRTGCRWRLDDFIYYEFEYPKIYAKAWRKFAEDHDVPLLMGGRACHPLDLLQHYRGINQLTEDIFERPEKIKAISDVLVECEAMRAMKQAMIMGAGEVPGAEIIFFVNGGPPGMPPRIFDEFSWPYAKKSVDLFVERGFRVRCHWDNDLTPYLGTMKHITDGLPRGKVLPDLEKTNMKKAKEVLGDRVCILGNVPSALLVYGTPGEVEKCCRKLIEDCAEGGGFILSTELKPLGTRKRKASGPLLNPRKNTVSTNANALNRDTPSPLPPPRGGRVRERVTSQDLLRLE